MLHKFHVGDVFGPFTILGDSGKRTPRGMTLYTCRCRYCDNEVTLRSTEIMKYQSCGCQAKKGRGFCEGTYIPLIRLDKKIPNNNTSGTVGVYKQGSYWVANIKFQQQRIILGAYKNKSDAIRARKEAELMIFAPVVEEYDGKTGTKDEREQKPGNRDER